MPNHVAPVQVRAAALDALDRTITGALSTGQGQGLSGSRGAGSTGGVPLPPMAAAAELAAEEGGVLAETQLEDVQNMLLVSQSGACP